MKVGLRWQRWIPGVALAGIGLLVLNVTGIVVPLRSSDIDGYVDFAGGKTLPYQEAARRLAGIDASRMSKEDVVTEATRIIHQGMAHVSPEDVRENGLDYYAMRVPATENWVLFLLSFLKPDTYRDYEFCSYERALERGTGRCGQQSLALVSFLSDKGIDTGFVSLGGHAIATAEVADAEWYLLDPDYGGVVPYDIEEAERDPRRVLEHYWSPAAENRRLDRLYGSENSVTYGGPRARYARACPIESAAYVAKWAIPVAMLLPLAIPLWRRGR